MTDYRAWYWNFNTGDEVVSYLPHEHESDALLFVHGRHEASRHSDFCPTPHLDCKTIEQFANFLITILSVDAALDLA